jgi:DNA-binding LacI/PurR family transcriptional regulator
VDGARQACAHLISLGHKHIAFLGDATSGRTVQERLDGFKRTMEQAGLEVSSYHIHLVPGSNAGHGYQAVEYFLKLNKLPSAIMCYNDVMALGLLKGLQQANLHVPGDISVTGFDNISVAEFTTPPLTTIDQPKRFLGGEAARMMLEQLTGKALPDGNEPRIKCLKGTLLVRQSTAPPGK